MTFFWTFVLLNTVDAAATVWLMERGGYELNPAMSWLLEQGWWEFFVVKVAVGVLLGAVALRYSPRLLKLGTVLFALLCVYQVGLVTLGL